MSDYFLLMLLMNLRVKMTHFISNACISYSFSIYCVNFIVTLLTYLLQVLTAYLLLGILIWATLYIIKCRCSTDVKLDFEVTNTDM